jgi:hypothetical protein
MALVTDGFTLYVELVDRGGDSTTKSFELSSANYAAAITDAATVVAALDAATYAKIRQYSVSEKFKEDSFTLPLLGQIEEQALLVLRLSSDPTKSATTSIPAPVDGMFMDTSGDGFNVIDPTDSVVIAYVDLFKTGNQAYISDGEIASSLVSGRRIHRKSRRG